MNKNRLTALLITSALCVTLLTGCGTSRVLTDDSELENASWEELLVSSEETEEPEETEAKVVMPSLDETEYGTGQDVTSSYKSAFVGIWDSEDGTEVYEFLQNENLNITDAAGNTTNYTYWFTDTGVQVQLNIFENGQAAALVYNFTLNGSNLTLYNVDTGSMEQQLIRRMPEEETTAAATATPVPTASSGQTTAAATAAPTPTPSPSPSEEPSEEPSPSPSEDETETEPSPSPSPADNWEISDSARQAMDAIECALDFIREGGSFSAEDPESFWGVMARYAVLGDYPEEDGYYVLTPDEALECASRIFSDAETLPECPEDSSIAIHDIDGDTEQYRLLQGEISDLDIATVTENEDGTLIVTVRDDGNAFDYLVVLNGSAIVSISLT